MRVLLVVGSHKFDDTAYVLKRLKRYNFNFLITSASEGVNAIARSFARRTGKKYKIFTADWVKYNSIKGKNPAGVINAEEMIKFAKGMEKQHEVFAVAIIKDASPGTTNEINLIRKYRIRPLRVFDYDTPDLNSIFEKYEKSL